MNLTMSSNLNVRFKLTVDVETRVESTVILFNIKSKHLLQL